MSSEDFLMWALVALVIGLMVFLFVCSLLFIGLMAGWWVVPQ
jgi:hypothetical protein